MDARSGAEIKERKKCVAKFSIEYRNVGTFTS
jgi:hypothetical protein